MSEDPGSSVGAEAAGRYDLALLQAELNRVDLLIQRAVRLWQQAGQDPNEPFRGLTIPLEEAARLAERTPCSSWGGSAHLPEEEEAALLESYRQAAEQAQAIRDQAAAGGTIPRLDRLARGFELSGFEYNAFLLCLTPSLDVRYERLYAFLQDDVTRKQPCANLILDLLLEPGIERLGFLEAFADQGVLPRYYLLRLRPTEPGENPALLRRAFSVPPEVTAWLLGSYRPDPDLAEAVRVYAPPATAEISDLADWPRILEQRPLLAFYGPDGQRQHDFALRLAGLQQRALLEVDLAALKNAGTLPAEGALARGLLRLALRDAVLLDAIPYFTGWDSLAGPDGSVPAAFLQELNACQSVVIASSGEIWRSAEDTAVSTAVNPEVGDKLLLWQSFDLPGAAQRLALWQGSLDGDRERIDGPALEILAGQFILTSAQIQAAAQAARSSAFHNNRPLALDDLFQAARERSSHHLDSLAVRLAPRYGWGDIVLPEDGMAALHEIADTIRERPRVLEEWGVGRKLASSAGVSALFTGPPGTGKTLAAQVIAAELGMELYKIDLSTVVSKYIGDTEKNLERIFTQAQNSNAILFFDEADAIFGKRSEVKDAHDRYANIEVGYLLQRMETFDGVVILASNMPANFDEAFIRRLQFVVKFPFPDEAQQARIWQVLFPPSVPRGEEIDFECLARRFRLSGANIRNAIIAAAFLAASEGGSVTTRHLLHGIRREMQKMGRLISERELSLT